MPKTTLRIPALIFTLLTLSAASASAELILGVSTRTGNPDIFLVDPVTGDALNLTKHKAQDVSPALWADGKRIAFSSDRDSSEEKKVFDIFVMDEDGGNLRQLTKDTGVNGTPCWSPDGKKIAFVRYLANGGPQVFVMNADGSEQASITPGRSAYDPAWSPDGKKIAHTSFVNGHGFHLWIMDADGKNARQLSANDNSFGYVYPSWSPDGKKIAYADFIDQHLEIFTCDADGANPTQVTRLAKTSTFPAWSPDGKAILFQHATSANTGPVCVLDLTDGTGNNVKALEVFRDEGFVSGGRHLWKTK
jgi:TolB protein